jgi:aryl-alcohol dehydrogenase-like predicted oxidoreductase
MRYRLLGRTGLSVSEIGFGAWGIGGETPGPTSYGRTNDDVSIAALRRALARGVNFYDTSNVYGYGRSETLIGEAFTDCREKVVIASKVGFIDYQQEPNYTVSWIEKSLEGTLRRLRTDRVDLLQFHNASAKELSALPETMQLFENLKRAGTIKAIGVSVKSPEDIPALLDFFPFDAVQVNFNMMDIRVLRLGLIDLVVKNNVGLIARTPLAFGFLTGMYSGEEIFHGLDHRSRWPEEQLRLWSKGAKLLHESCLESKGISPIASALRFCLSYEGVTATIPGMLTPEEVDTNIDSIASGPLEQASLKAVESLHDRQSFIVS